MHFCLKVSINFLWPGFEFASFHFLARSWFSQIFEQAVEFAYEKTYNGSGYFHILLTRR